MSKNQVKNCKSDLGGRKIEVKNFHCSYPGCSLSYSRQWKLDRHFCSHTGKRPFRCDNVGCEKSYQSKSHLLRHIRSSHSIVELLPCMFHSCKATFKDKWALIKHIKNHGRSRKFQCSVCEKSFITEARLTSHELEHKGVLPFSCQMCNVKWPTAALLRRHMTVHDAVQCQYQGCSVIVNSKKSLRKHLVTEHRTYYTCEHCRKSFNNKGILRDHVLIHLPPEVRGIIPCPHKPCSRIYFQKRNLQHHIKVFHNTPRFYCTVPKCEKSCRSEAALKRHTRVKHKLYGDEVKEAIIQNLANIIPIKDETQVEPLNEPAQFEFRVINRYSL